MVSDLAREAAAKAWRTPKTCNLYKDPDLIDAFAAILEEIWTQPWLGNATTGELLAELQTCAEINGYAKYRTVGPHDDIANATAAGNATGAETSGWEQVK